MLKQTLISLALPVSLFALSLATPLDAFAQTTITTVSGIVKDASNNPVSGMTVHLDCSNGHTASAVTKSDGSYQAVFDGSNTCPENDTVSASGSKNGQSGGASGKVHKTGTFGEITLDFAVVNFSIPEFSTILGLVGGLGSLGAYFGLKKKMA